MFNIYLYFLCIDVLPITLPVNQVCTYDMEDKSNPGATIMVVVKCHVFALTWIRYSGRSVSVLTTKLSFQPLF